MRTGIGIFASGKGRPPHVRLQQILDGGAACVFIEAARWGRPRTNVWVSLEARVLTVHEAFRAGGGEEEIMARHLSNRLRTRLEAIDRASAAEVGFRIYVCGGTPKQDRTFAEGFDPIHGVKHTVPRMESKRRSLEVWTQPRWASASLCAAA